MPKPYYEPRYSLENTDPCLPERASWRPGDYVEPSSGGCGIVDLWDREYAKEHLKANPGRSVLHETSEARKQELLASIE